MGTHDFTGGHLHPPHPGVEKTISSGVQMDWARSPGLLLINTVTSANIGTYLCLSFLYCKIQITVIVLIAQRYWGDSMSRNALGRGLTCSKCPINTCCHYCVHIKRVLLTCQSLSGPAKRLPLRSNLQWQVGGGSATPTCQSWGKPGPLPSVH